ncbi:MAG: isoprenylcysteine carboxylmethyltransferase family protein [Alphaproteobacteria bacterium]|nr:isoprenylcysteine carboxylmethyltransferase family protein [Alphaproteobacteria bacterium]
MTLDNPAAARARRIKLELSKLQDSRAYDLLMRLPLTGWSMFCATLQMAGLARYVREADPALPLGAYAVNLAMRLSTIAFLLLLAASVLLRARPTGKARGLEPRISAFGGAFLVYAIPFFPRRELSVTVEMVSTLLVLFGSAAAVYALMRLGRSFSMMAEARRLVTSGPYRFIRHPLYLAEQLAVVGLAMQFSSWATALVLVVQIAFQLRRMHNEEAVLAESFPEYAAYRQRTARLVPGIY